MYVLGNQGERLASSSIQLFGRRFVGILTTHERCLCSLVLVYDRRICFRGIRRIPRVGARQRTRSCAYSSAVDGGRSSTWKFVRTNRDGFPRQRCQRTYTLISGWHVRVGWWWHHWYVLSPPLGQCGFIVSGFACVHLKLSLLFAPPHVVGRSPSPLLRVPRTNDNHTGTPPIRVCYRPPSNSNFVFRSTILRPRVPGPATRCVFQGPWKLMQVHK